MKDGVRTPVELVREMRAMREAGHTVKAIAIAMCVSYRTAKKYCRGVTPRQITPLANDERQQLLQGWKR